MARMADKRFEKGSEEWTLFMDFWQICQKYWGVEDNDNYWQEFLTDADNFYKKYRCIPLAGRIIIALIETQEQQLKESKIKSGKEQ